MLLKKKTAIITGCNRGIGEKILEKFSSSGANIFACTRKKNSEFESKISELARKYKVKIIPIYFDFADSEEIKSAAKKILDSGEAIDILVNNAGIIDVSIYQMTSIKKLKDMFEINFFSQTIFTQNIIKSMIRNKSGSIINLASITALDGNEGRSAYGASKSALIAQMKTLSKEVGIFNIRVNCIAPGLIDTEMLSKNTPKNIIENMKNKISLRRVGNPEEIADVALFLSSNLSTYISGQVIRVDGGM
jgi:3-oxoacyl-[acyl-carrier protein] reductase|tara:strand:- start:835 stop:1578 length:744 start_codon:yes stop_codon:yes gene_type:complete